MFLFFENISCIHQSLQRICIWLQELNENIAQLSLFDCTWLKCEPLRTFSSCVPLPTTPQVYVYLKKKRKKSCLSDQWYMSNRFLFDTPSMARRCTTALACQIGARRRYTTSCPCIVQKRPEFLGLTLTASGDGSKPGPLKKAYLNTEVCLCFKG